MATMVLDPRPWFVGRATGSDFDGMGRMVEMVEWIRSLGVDPTNIALNVLVVDRAGQYELHLTEHVLDAAGQKAIDLATDTVVSHPVIVPVEKDSWPTWLTGLNSLTSG